MNQDDSNQFSSDARERLLFAIQSLCEIGEELSNAEQFQASSHSILHLIMGTVVISKAAVLLNDHEKHVMTIASSRGVDNTDIALPLPPLVQKVLHRQKEPFRLREMEDHETLGPYFQDHENELLELHSHVWVPLHVKSRFLGVVSVSRKFMNQDYEPVDLELLNIIGQQLSIALNNFYLIQDLKQTNFLLNRKLLEQETLFDLGIAIGSIMEKEELAETILFNAVGLTDASSGFLALIDGEGLIMETSINIDKEEQDKIIDFALNHELSAAGEPYLNNKESEELRELGFHKLLVVPISGQRETQGIIGLADKESRDGFNNFDESDVRLLQNFASQAGVAIENAKFYAESLEKERYERELTVAATIQRNILPEKPPIISGLQIAATTIPSRYVGGDHYDFFARDNYYFFTVADVSGKGIPAALLVSTLHATQHALFNHENSPENLVSKINKAIHKSSLSNKFITFFLIQYFPEEQKLVTVNAGHNPPYIISKDGSMKKLQTGGLVLGLMPDVSYMHESTKIETGDVLVSFTDGVTEAMNIDDEEYGEERLEEIIVKNRDKDAQVLFDLIMKDVEKFTGGAPQHDDITLVVYKFE